MNSRAVLVLALAASLAACGDDGAKPPEQSAASTVSGTVAGVSIPTVVETPSFAVTAVTCEGVSTSFIGVRLSDRTGVCAAFQASKSVKSEKSLSLFIVRVSLSASAAIGPGTYTVSATPDASGVFASAAIDSTDATCNSSVSEAQATATSGTITLTAVNGNAVEGRYSVTFPGGTMSGAFKGSGCAVPTSLQQSLCTGGLPVEGCQ